MQPKKDISCQMKITRYNIYTTLCVSVYHHLLTVL